MVIQVRGRHQVDWGHARRWTPFLKLVSMLSQVRMAKATSGIVVVLSVWYGKMLASQM